MDEIEKKGQMVDQEKVNRVDFSLYALKLDLCDKNNLHVN